MSDPMIDANRSRSNASDLSHQTGQVPHKTAGGNLQLKVQVLSADKAGKAHQVAMKAVPAQANIPASKASGLKFAFLSSTSKVAIQGLIKAFSENDLGQTDWSKVLVKLNKHRALITSFLSPADTAKFNYFLAKGGKIENRELFAMHEVVTSIQQNGGSCDYGKLEVTLGNVNKFKSGKLNGADALTRVLTDGAPCINQALGPRLAQSPELLSELIYRFVLSEEQHPALHIGTVQELGDHLLKRFPQEALVATLSDKERVEDFKSVLTTLSKNTSIPSKQLREDLLLYVRDKKL